MDQAISINAIKDCAALIDFVPKLKLTNVKLPPSFVSFPFPFFIIFVSCNFLFS